MEEDINNHASQMNKPENQPDFVQKQKDIINQKMKDNLDLKNTIDTQKKELDKVNKKN